MKNQKQQLIFAKIKKEKSGFTLTEIIISLSVVLLIFILVTSIYTLNQKTYGKTDAKAEIVQNGRVIIDRMVREIRQTPDIITQLPASNANPNQTPSEIMFQNGHDAVDIRYIRYYLDGTNIKRQIVVYYFPNQPDYYVRVYDTDKDAPHGPPTEQILEEKIVGEYVDDIEFWGNNLINISLNLSRNEQSAIITTAVYGRNL